MKFFINKKPIKFARGFIIPLTLLVTLIILTISVGISVILSKEMYFSQLSRQSQLAYYAADNAMMCTVAIDDQYIDPDTGLGIFSYDSTTPQDVLNKIAKNNNNIPSLNSIKCAQAVIFDSNISGFKISDYTRKNSLNVTENGKSSQFSMKMDLDGTGKIFRCAKVTVNKTPMYRQIIARGYTSCDVTSKSRVERAVIDTTEVN